MKVALQVVGADSEQPCAAGSLGNFLERACYVMLL